MAIFSGKYEKNRLSQSYFIKENVEELLTRFKIDCFISIFEVDCKIGIK